MDDLGLLRDIKTIGGTSAGAIAATAFVMSKINPDIWWQSLNFPRQHKPQLAAILDKDGLIDSDDFIKDFVELAGREYTFQEVWEETGIELFYGAYCVDDAESVHFCRETHPDLCIQRAMTASMAVPIMVTSVEIQGKRYIDGGINEKFPIEASCVKPGTCFIAGKWYNEKWDLGDSDKSIKSIGLALLNILLNNRSDVSRGYPVLQVPCRDDVTFDFGCSVKTKMQLFTMGYRSIMLYRELNTREDNADSECDQTGEGCPQGSGPGIQ